MAEKKSRTKIPQETKVRAMLQKEIGSICPFCDNEDAGHFQIHHIDDDPSNHAMENLLLVCAGCHSKITKNDISQIDVLKRKVQLTSGAVQKQQKAKVIQFNSQVGNAFVGDNHVINIKPQAKKAKNKYPEGTIGFDRDKMNYISYLTGKYNEFKEYEVGKGNVRYGVFGAHLKKKYGIGPTKAIYNLSIDKFEELACYIQNRIDGTMLGKINRKSQQNYCMFPEYLEKYVNN